MKRKPNPYIQHYKKLHREKVKRKVSVRFLFAVLDRIKGIYDRCADEVADKYFINKIEGE